MSHKPIGCTYPDCFGCKLPDCQYSDEDIQKDNWAKNKARLRQAKPEQYREAQRKYRASVERRDPGHYARLQRLYRQKKEEADAT